MRSEQSNLVAHGLHTDDQGQAISPSPSFEIHQGAFRGLPSSLCKPSLRTYFDWQDSWNDDYARRPVLLDLFSGAGGAAFGYYLAGFRVVGVDNVFQKHYPFEFYLADALEYLAQHGAEFDAIHASPPCQAYSMAGRQWRSGGKEYPDLIDKTRQALLATGKPFVIENVTGAPLINPIVLNAAHFGMNLRRTRLFETSFNIPFMLLPKEGPSHFRMGRPPKNDDPIVPVGHFSNILKARTVMGIDWMTGAELSQAIPPAYTEYIGLQLMQFLCYNGNRKELQNEKTRD